MFGSQIRAARGLLGWTRDELAAKAKLTATAIKNIETDPTISPHSGTIAALRNALHDAGVELIERGARFRDDSLLVLEGDNAYMLMLDDVFHATRDGGEVLWFCSDDRSPLAGEIEAEERIRSSGTRFRCLIEAGNPVHRWAIEEYRTIPSEYFNHNLQVIYGDKVAQVINGGEKILIIHDSSLATTERNKFNMMWPLMRPLKESANG